VGPGTQVTHSLMGVYKALYYRNIPVTFLHTKDLTDMILTPFTVIYVPFPITLSNNASKALQNYIFSGGKLISEARLAWTNENGFANEKVPGAGFDQVFGVYETNVLPVPTQDGSDDGGGPNLYDVDDSDHHLCGQVSDSSSWFQFNANNSFGLKGLQIPLSVFQEEFSVQNGNVLASFSNGAPAVVESKFGKGSTLIIGSFLGLTAMAETTTTGNATTALGGLMAWAGVTAPVSVTFQGQDWSQYVEVRVLTAPTQKKWVVLCANRGPNPALLKVTLAKLSTKANQALELISNKTVTLSGDGQNTHFDLDLTQSMFAVIVFDIN